MYLRLAPKLHDKHIFPNNFEKMRVCLASQIFSRSIAAGISTHTELGAMPPEAIHTAHFINKMDMLFDTFNSSQQNHFKHHRVAISHNNTQILNLNDFEDWIKTWKVIGCKSLIPCIDGWLLNIAS